MLDSNDPFDLGLTSSFSYYGCSQLLTAERKRLGNESVAEKSRQPIANSPDALLQGFIKMDRLPSEILLHILDYVVVAHYSNKNNLLKLRTTCKLFDEVLKPYVLKTLQLEFTRLDKGFRARKPLDDDALRRIGPLCQALYIDMMVVRDDGEVRFLGEMFSQIPAMAEFVEELRDSWCMNEESFTEIDYRRQLGFMLAHAPNVAAVKLNLPFQLVSPGQYRASTMVLGNTFAALAQRPDEESAALRTLVLENLSDVSVVSLWRNPQDVKNIMAAFRDLRRLFLSVRRNDGEDGLALNVNFRHRLWEMIGKAQNLESLCLVDLDTDEKRHGGVKTSSQRDVSLEDWLRRCMPMTPMRVLPKLTFLELRQAEVMGSDLLSMFKCFGDSLRELYLDGVYLKTAYSAGSPQDIINNTLWIGLPNVRPPPNHRWVATYLRQIRVRLRVCRVANLGYYQYVMGEEEPPTDHTTTTTTTTTSSDSNSNNSAATFDLADPCGLSRSLEQRFVEVATGVPQPPTAAGGAPVTHYYPEEAMAQQDGLRPPPPPPLRTEDWHATSYLATRRSPTSAWQRSVDGQFPNCNQHTLAALHNFADAAHRGMALLNQRAHENDELPGNA
ncbi:hypothetical protein GGR53DRAFT_472544 [Hypoxylon sp. FL1150]|nr:hypothetical protein GGR53DRAFT_472544 [Hypoxylon sp. FL1150]